MIEEADPLDLIEARVKALELKVFGNKFAMENADDFVSENKTDIVEMLIKSQTIMNSAITGQEKINKMVKRLDQLEAISDPSYEDSLLNNETKVEMVALMENDFNDVLRKLNRLKELSTVLDSEQIRNIPKLEDKLNSLIVATYESKEKVDEVSININDLLTRYNHIINGFTKTFAQLNETITDLEIDSQPITYTIDP